MATSPSYIPSRDADLDFWALNFSSLIAAGPGTYGLITADATAITAAYTSWHAAYLLVTSPDTKTATTVAAKDVAKINLLALVRPYAIQISLNPGVSVDDKVALAINPRTNTPTPVPAPTSAPVLSLIGATYLQHTLRYRDEGAPATSRAKPPGVTAIEIYAATSATIVTNPELLPLKTTASKVPVVVSWDSSDQAKVAYYATRWITQRQLRGPWSAIQAIVVV